MFHYLSSNVDFLGQTTSTKHNCDGVDFLSYIFQIPINFGMQLINEPVMTLYSKLFPLIFFHCAGLHIQQYVSWNENTYCRDWNSYYQNFFEIYVINQNFCQFYYAYIFSTASVTSLPFLFLTGSNPIYFLNPLITARIYLRLCCFLHTESYLANETFLNHESFLQPLSPTKICSD